MREAICDTSPLQYLHQIGCLPLLADFYTGVLIPPAVVSELERGQAMGIDLPDVGSMPWLQIRIPQESHRVPAVAELGSGEKEVLALGTQFPEAVVILDERLGRLHAAALKLTVTGNLEDFCARKQRGEYFRLSRSSRTSIVWDFVCPRKRERRSSDRPANDFASGYSLCRKFHFDAAP